MNSELKKPFVQKVKPYNLAILTPMAWMNVKLALYSRGVLNYSGNVGTCTTECLIQNL